MVYFKKSLNYHVYLTYVDDLPSKVYSNENVYTIPDINQLASISKVFIWYTHYSDVTWEFEIAGISIVS